MHDHCYGRLEEEGCSIRTQSYKYRFAQGLVTCGKAGLPIQVSRVQLPERPASLCLGETEQGQEGRAAAALSDLQGRTDKA
jgi:hypothetical protein